MSHEDRILIKQLRIKDHRSGKVWGVKRLQKEFPWKNWKSSTLKDLLRKIDNTGDCTTRRPGSGRPKSVRTEENCERVEELILSQEGQQHSHSTRREIERETGISRSSARSIIKQDLRLSQFKRKRVQVLTARNKEQRLQCCRRLLERFSISFSTDLFCVCHIVKLVD